MPFGLSPTEILFSLAVLLAPAGVLLLGIRAFARRSGADRHLHEVEHRQLTAELDAAQGRVAELEAKLERTEERAAFTEALLEGDESSRSR